MTVPKIFSKLIFTLMMITMVSTTMAYQEDDAPKKEKLVVKAVMEDGKLFIIDENGEKQEVDTSDARSIAIEQSSKVVDQDGERQEITGGKAILIGPDGQKTEFEFDGGGLQLPGINLRIGGMRDGGLQDIIPAFPDRPEIILPEIRGLGAVGPRGWRVNRGESGKYMVGVHCSPSSETLRSHLDLDDIGLTVETVVPSSPAADAELQQHDILLFANDQQLASLNDLTKAVELAGKEGSPVAFTFLRAGVEKTVELTPKERPANVGGVRAAFPGGFEAAMPGFEFRDLGPGIILDADTKFDEAFKDIRTQMEMMRKEMRQEMKQMIERDR